jgi:hypothetical protein
MPGTGNREYKDLFSILQETLDIFIADASGGTWKDLLRMNGKKNLRAGATFPLFDRTFIRRMS